jgi:hypothetical protein
MHKKASTQFVGRAEQRPPSADVEKQQLGPCPADVITPDRHMASLQCLFGLPESQLRGYQGARAYCRYLETCFEPLLADEYASVWSAIGEQRPKSAAGCWLLFDTLCSAIRMLSVDSSIEDVWAVLCPPTPVGSPMAAPNMHARDPCFIAVFSVLCWASMTLQPRLCWTDFKDRPSFMVQRRLSNSDGLRMESVKRPIPALFRQFRRTMPITRWQHTIGESKTDTPTALEVSCLNYASLKVMAKINLVWVNDLTCHLEFDAPNRQLSIFRFPSFCALSAMSSSKTPSVPVLER